MAGSPGRPRKVQEPEPVPEQEGLVRAEVIVLGSFALAVLLFLSNFHLCGFAGDFLRGIQLGLFGLPGYVAPLVLFVGTCFYQANRGNRVAVQKTVASAAAFFLLCGFAQMIFGQQPEAGKGILEYYRLSASSGMGGGLFGGLLFGGIRSFYRKHWRFSGYGGWPDHLHGMHHPAFLCKSGEAPQ